MFDAEGGAGNGGLTDPHHVALTIQNHPIGGALTANASVDLSTIGGGGGSDGVSGGKSGGRGGGGGLVRQGSSDGGGSGRSLFKFGGWGGGGGGDGGLENEKIPPLPEELHTAKVGSTWLTLRHPPSPSVTLRHPATLLTPSSEPHPNPISSPSYPNPIPRHRSC